MAQQRNALLLEHEGRLQLALQAYNRNEFKSYRAAANAFNVKSLRLSKRARGVPFQLKTPPNSRKLTQSEEQTIIQYILDLNSRGFSPQLCEVANIADKLLGQHNRGKVGKN